MFPYVVSTAGKAADALSLISQQSQSPIDVDNVMMRVTAGEAVSWVPIAGSCSAYPEQAPSMSHISKVTLRHLQATRC